MLLEVKEVLPVAARALKLTIQPWEVRDSDGFEKVFAALSKQRPDGLLCASWRGPLMRPNRKPDRRLGVKEPVAVDVLATNEL